MINDEQLRTIAVRDLQQQPGFDEREMRVHVDHRVVTFSGFVASFAQKYALVRAVKHVEGVRVVADELQVDSDPPNVQRRPNIGPAVSTALRWEPEVPATVTAVVENAWVTLGGSVDWEYQKAAAERAIQRLTNVAGILNLIAVRPARDVTNEISRSIFRALRGVRGDTRVRIEAEDGHVTLRGRVRDTKQRLDAERAAWTARGVTEVEDLPEIAP